MKVYHGSYTEISHIDLTKITKLDFLEELTYHEDTHQICFCTLVSLQTPSRSCNDPVRKIADESAGYYKKSWTEIYEMLKKELKM
jgi:hypothetical protein